MKKQLITLVALVAIPALSFAQTADDIINKNITAIGGADKIAAVKSAQFDQNMNIMGMDMSGKTTVVVGQSSRADITAMGQQITQVVDGDKGWAINPMAGSATAQAMPDDQIKMQKGNTYLVGTDLATAKNMKYPVELVGKEKMNDKDVYNLKVTRPEGVANYYVDATNYQLMGMKATINVQGQSGEVKQQFSNYKTIDGLTLPSTIELNSPAMPGAVTMTLSNMVFNPKIDPSISLCLSSLNNGGHDVRITNQRDANNGVSFLLTKYSLLNLHLSQSKYRYLRINNLIFMKSSSLLKTIGCAIILFSLAPAQAQNLSGFVPARQAAEVKLENEFKGKQSSAAFKNHLEKLSSVPHITGSKENEQVRDYIAETMRKAGWQVDIYPHDVLLPKGPGEIAVELVEPIRQPLNIREFLFKEDKYSSDPRLTPGYNAWSGSGDVTAEVVYANYGRKEDFEQLKAMGISVKDKIVLARYGGNFRGYKAQWAQAAGAIGVIIFTDPADSGYTRGLTFPEGPYYSESVIQRGSLLTTPYTGDPLTPGEAALPMDAKNTPKRLDQNAIGLHKIPVTPLPYGSATEILKRMTGAKAVPAGWQGGLPYTYRLEGGKDLKVRLMVKQEKAIQRIYQVVGTLTGAEFPDEWIIAGCHYDAWSYGATDPNSGTAMLLSMTESLGKLAKAGQRPRRTIKVCHWDAEEPGVIGSAEWSEQFRDELTQKAVAYMNYDAAVSGRTFGASASPSMKKLIIEATQSVQYPDSNKTVYQHWMGHKSANNPTRVTGSSAPATLAGEPTIGNLGGGSDHIAPYMHIGIPSLSAGMEGPTLYHSQYDDLYFYDKFADPTYKMGPMMEQVVGTMTLRLANADLVPYDVARYPTDLEIHLKAAERAIQAYAPTYSIAPLLSAVADMKKNADACEIARQNYLKTGRTDKLVELNKELRLLERSFIDPKGNAFGGWYKSLYASSDPNSGYASWMLPGLLYEASLKSTTNLPDLETRYKKAIQTLSDKLLALSQGMGTPAAVGSGK